MQNLRKKLFHTRKYSYHNRLQYSWLWSSKYQDNLSCNQDLKQIYHRVRYEFQFSAKKNSFHPYAYVKIIDLKTDPASKPVIMNMEEPIFQVTYLLGKMKTIFFFWRVRFLTKNYISESMKDIWSI